MITKLKNFLTSNINKETELVVVNTDNDKPKPPYPFVSYKITSSQMQDGGQGYIYNDELENGDVKEYLTLERKLVISFQVYATDIDEALEKCIDVWSFIRFSRFELRDLGFVIHDLGTIQDRTVVLGNHYEYRQGFDLTLRYNHIIERTVEPIEKWDNLELNKRSDD